MRDLLLHHNTILYFCCLRTDNVREKTNALIIIVMSKEEINLNADH